MWIIQGLFSEVMDGKDRSRSGAQELLFHMGSLSPFAANLAFEVYGCEEPRARYIRVLLHEVPLRLAQCSRGKDGVCLEEEIFPLAQGEEVSSREPSTCGYDMACQVPVAWEEEGPSHAHHPGGRRQGPDEPSSPLSSLFTFLLGLMGPGAWGIAGFM